MQKDFDNWNNKKKSLENKSSSYLFKTGDIWWCSVGLNIGTESCGKGTDYQRPVLVLKKLSKENCIGIPLSTQKKDGTWFTEITIHGEQRYALLYQIRMFHTKRFQRRLATLDDKDMNIVRIKLKTLLEL